ncbi:unnamed protein product, partial [Closterium sp. NIES-54]
TKNVSNNHFIQHAGRLLSLWEAGLPYSLDPSTLHTKGVHSFDDTWRSGMTAHPKVDPVTNHMMIYGYNLTHKPYLHYGVVDPSGSLVHATDLDLPHPVMMHDFAITEHYSIFLDFPLRFQLDKVIQSHGKAKPFVFDPSKPSCVGILPRFGSNPDMRWFTVDPGFCLHVVNAFEEPSSPDSSSSTSPTFSSSPSSPAIVLRVIRFPAFSALGLAELADELACDEVARLYEYRLDLQSGAVEERFVCKVLMGTDGYGWVCCDFPSINPKSRSILLSFTPSTSPFHLSSIPPPPALVCCDFPSINPKVMVITPQPPLSLLTSSPSTSSPLYRPQICCKFPTNNPIFLCSFQILPFHYLSSPLPLSPPAQVCCDFPSINPNFTGRPHRFAYSARFTAQPGPGEQFRGILGWVSSSPVLVRGGTSVPSFSIIVESSVKHDSVQGTYQVPNAPFPSPPFIYLPSPPLLPLNPPPGTTVPSFNAIMKHDFAQGTYQVHTLPPGRFCGEPLFAPRHHFQGSSRSQSGEARSDEVGMGRDVVGLGADAVGMDAEEEDDGWVLAHVWNEEEMKSEVIVLDAMNLDKQPLARVILPKRVPYGFHGTFLPD